MLPEKNQHLSQISTMWSVLFQAHSEQLEEASPAQLRMLQRYYSAIQRYLLGALRDQDAAEELSQEFAFRFIRGDFQGANPSKGRFRDYLKTVLFRLVANYYKVRATSPQAMPEGVPEPAAEVQPAESEREFLDIWRRELLNRAWQSLADLQGETGQPYHDVLQLRVEHSHTELSSAQIAERMSAQFGRKFTSDGVRKLLQRAREKLVEFMIEEVAHSLENATPEQLEAELRDLGLLTYCRTALNKRKNQRSSASTVT